MEILDQLEAWLRLAGVEYRWCEYDDSLTGKDWWVYQYPTSFPVEVRNVMHDCHSLEEILAVLEEVL